MNHHTQETKCPLCEEKLAECDPELREIYERIKSAFPDCHISWGWRGKVDQNEFYKLKKTNKPWPKSSHNVLKLGKPCSTAIDLFRINDMGKAEFVREYFLAIAQYLYHIGVVIDWSGDWSGGTLQESNHFELRKV